MNDERTPDRHGLLVVNADDWGRDLETTDRTLDCLQRGTVSAVSAMVFMEDSERAATLAGVHGVDAGLHLNFTTPFSAPGCPSKLMEHQQRLTQYLRRHRFAPVLFHPGLSGSFDYVVKAQLDEYRRLFGADADRIDGHHHMHLAANVVLAGLMPAGTFVRRNFTFRSGEKGSINRMYRGAVDRLLSRRHGMMDYLFTLPPLAPHSRLERIFSLAREAFVEVETHPVVPEEYRFLMEDDIYRLSGKLPIASFKLAKRTRLEPVLRLKRAVPR